MGDHFLEFFRFMNQTVTNSKLYLEAGEHAVLLLHGLGATTVEVERLGRHLHTSGLSIFARNIDGYCYGTPPSTWNHWLAQAIDDVQHLRQRYATVSVAGVSMGATLALAVAQQESIDCL